MHTETIQGSARAHLFQPPAFAEATSSDVSDSVLRAGDFAAAAEHDASLLVMALEQLQLQRAAIEWLLDADLLRLCLV